VAVIYQTTMVPSKRQLLTAWLPKQDWYAGKPEGPSLASDPVLLAQLAELIRGRVQAQAQSQSNTPDATVHAVPVDGASGERLSVLFARRLVPADPAAVAEPGQVTGLWTAPDGALIRSVFATARPAPAR
jgi:hypothetical protein